MKRTVMVLFAACCAGLAPADGAAPVAETPSKWSFDAGADLRIREEIMENVPGLPGGGVLSSAVRGGVKNHVRFRPDVWGEVRLDGADAGKWRVRARLVDEFRWNIEPYDNRTTFPGELIFDNLFLEGVGAFDGLLDLRIGRQDLYGYCGLDHLFVDGTPGDGSRTTYTDMANMRLHVSDVSTVDLFGLYNFDDSHDFRWGTDRSRHMTSSGLGGGAETEMDDWGYGVIWGSEIRKGLPYQLFLLQKNTHEFERDGVEHPWTQRETMGFKTVPQLNEEWSLQLEGMGQVGCNGEGATLWGWSAYSGVNWKSATTSTVKPFGKFGYHFMSGDDDAATEDGGHAAWDPVWSRAVNDSEMFLYGTHYGVGWWSNMHYLKLTTGLDFGAHHRLTLSTGPMFAAAQDGLGGGDGFFKGLLSQAKYEFPIWLADRSKGERFEVFGHLLGEFFNPGDYFETARPAYFIRWQVEFRF